MLFVVSAKTQSLTNSLTYFFYPFFQRTLPTFSSCTFPRYYFNLPDTINEKQAADFLAILEHTFHQIVEYQDDEEPVVDDLASQELGEF